MSLPLHPSCRILKAQDGLIAVEKAAGVLSHPNRVPDVAHSVLTVPYDAGVEAYVDGEQRWYLLNRLDSPTSGVVLLAMDAEVAEAARRAFAEGTVEKTYLALVKGVLRRPSELWRDHLAVERQGGVLRTRVRNGVPNAVTRVELVRRGRGMPARCLLKLNPRTGRTHQLRVQCATRGLPIIGDASYGDFALNRQWRKRCGKDILYLHSQHTALRITVAGRTMAFEATSPMPDIFTVALDGSNGL